MTAEQVDAALAKLDPVHIESADLIGYELVTEDIDPADRFSVTALLYMIEDCNGRYGRKMDYKVAKDSAGKLTLWTLPPEPPTP
jgi:hypothetical protein